MQTLPIYLLMDNSDSMAGQKIRSANEALQYAINAMKAQAYLTNTQCLVRLIVFNSTIQPHDFDLLENFNPPQLRTGGLTDMIGALEQVKTDLDTDLKDKDYFLSPLILLITDGQYMTYWATNPIKEFMDYLDTFLAHDRVKEAIRVSVAIGEDVDHAVLEKFNSEGVKVLYANNSEDLINFVSWTRHAIGGGVAALLAAPQPESKGGKDW